MQLPFHPRAQRNAFRRRDGANPDRLPVGINRSDTSPTRTGFDEILGDYFPVAHRPLY